MIKKKKKNNSRCFALCSCICEENNDECQNIRVEVHKDRKNMQKGAQRLECLVAVVFSLFYLGASLYLDQNYTMPHAIFWLHNTLHNKPKSQ
jgi:hypothetical protein